MKFKFFFYLFISLLFTACNPSQECNEFDESFVSFELLEKMNFVNLSELNYKFKGDNLLISNEFNTSFEISDPNDCPHVFRETWEISQNDELGNLFSLISINGTGRIENNHLIEILVSSRAIEHNTNNLFTILLDFNGQPILQIGQSLHPSFLVNGISYDEVIEITREPLLTSSDLIEVVSLFFNLNEGILKFVREDGIEIELSN